MKIRSDFTRFLTQMIVGTSLLVSAGLAEAALPPHNDPDLEISRVRCQIDIDIDPATGVESPKVQIQGKARAGAAMEAHEIIFRVENRSVGISPVAPTIQTRIELGSATSDWDTFPDDASVTATIAGDFAVDGDTIRITAEILESGQLVLDEGQCATKTASQFRQDTKGVCTLRDFNRGKCKSGDILPDGSIMP